MLSVAGEYCKAIHVSVVKSCFIKPGATTLYMQPCVSVIANGKQKVEARAVLE